MEITDKNPIDKIGEKGYNKYKKIRKGGRNHANRLSHKRIRNTV